MSRWCHRRIVLGGPLHQARTMWMSASNPFLRLLLGKASGVMSSCLSSDTARSGFPEKSSRDAGNAPDTNHNATRLAAVGISGRIKHTCWPITPVRYSAFQPRAPAILPACSRAARKRFLRTSSSTSITHSTTWNGQAQRSHPCVDPSTQSVIQRAPSPATILMLASRSSDRLL